MPEEGEQMFGMDTAFWRTTLAAALALLAQGALCSETLTIYDDESEFLRNAPAVSTEGFDEFSKTIWDTAAVVFDEVHYKIYSEDYGPGACEWEGWVCWQVWTREQPISPPHVLVSWANLHGWWWGDEWETLSFGNGKAVRAVGFYYSGGVERESGSGMLRTRVRVVEANGAETNLDLSIQISDSLTSGFRYVGLISESGIVSVETKPGYPSWDGLGTLRGSVFDDVSRSEVNTVWLYASIDINPWSDRNLIDPGSTRLVPVAIHGSADFDALQADLKSLRLSPGDAESRNYRVMDVNRDGHMDLLAYFRSGDIQVGCGTTDMELTGRTHQGMDMGGSDSVTHMRCH